MPMLHGCRSAACSVSESSACVNMWLQDEVTESQRQLITANWGKLNLSRQGVERAKQTMVAALTAASQGPNVYHLSDRTASTNLAAEQVKAALEVIVAGDDEHDCGAMSKVKLPLLTRSSTT